ncbi:hypothetical protein L0664_07060 [Octadecabacter sp. G9-8]|uniref:DUF4267 domain-containing protein n=1 Tax=Octadecabacter dasysiphoniae TaxID=2909341 RepID=A0ABS9CV60_9RHOB|nr:hypothetical protein [Octadecabacter dasysiphoniae]MCF2870821.1 hypothetical protein [Octadecabacter dasysiphoniae]
MDLTRRIAGTVAIVSYLVMGAMLYFTVVPGADGLWPPDFHLRGYDAASIADFVNVIRDEASDTYAVILMRWDRIFIVSLALWLALTGWRGGWMRYFVAGLAALYTMVDLAENVAIFHFVRVAILDPDVVRVASHLTMAKFASLYLCGLVLIVHLRRSA